MKKDKTQSEKFIEKAKEIGADDKESAEAFEKAFKKIVPPSNKNKSGS